MSYRVFYHNQQITQERNLLIEKENSFFYQFFLSNKLKLLSGKFTTAEQAEKHIETMNEDQLQRWCEEGVRR